MNNRSLSILASSFALATFATGQTWTEAGDAGDLSTTAQTTVGVGPLTQIDGELPAGGDVDMYLIKVTDFQNFTCSSVGGATYDTQLWMFDLLGFGISFKDDDGPLQSTLTGQFLSGNGLVLVAISRYDNDALDAGGLALWADTPFAVERQPDGPGAANPVASWGPAGGASGPYSLFLNGAQYAQGGECFLMVGLTPTSFRIFNDTLLVEPLFLLPMTLTELPVLHVPASNGLVGISLYTQSLLYNPTIFPNDPLRLSQAIRFNIGVANVPYGQGTGLDMWARNPGPAQPGGTIEINFAIR